MSGWHCWSSSGIWTPASYPRKPLFSSVKRISRLSRSSHGWDLSGGIIFVARSWTPFNNPTFVLQRSDRNCAAYSRWRFIQGQLVFQCFNKLEVPRYEPELGVGLAVSFFTVLDVFQATADGDSRIHHAHVTPTQPIQDVVRFLTYRR